MGWLGLFGRSDTYLVAVTFEGKGHLRINGNHVRTGRKSKDNAAGHSRTICWIEFAPDGTRRDGGTGPMASCLGAGDAERLLRELPQTPACREVLADMGKGRSSSSRWLPWGESPADVRGSAGERR